MPSNRPVVLSVLLVAALAVAALPGTVPVAADATVDATGTTERVVDVQNTTGYLTVDSQSVENDRYGDGRLDVAGAVSVDVATLHGRYQSSSFRNAFFAADEQSTRVRLLKREADRIDARIRILRQRQRDALQQYNAGTLSTRRFLRELATVDAAAGRLRSDIRRIRSELAATGGFSLPNDLRTRLDNLESELVTLEGPVRDRLADSLAGNATAGVTYVMTAEDTIVLATATDQRYVREAYVGGDRVAGGVDRFGQTERPRISLAYQRAAELYPWAFDNALAPPSANGFGNTSVYRIEVSHSQGDLTTYLDGSTRNAYREIQHKRLVAVPTTTVTNRTGGLALRVNRTYATGPMRVGLSRANTTVPVTGTVRVNGQRVGTTSADGSLWTVTPSGFVNVTVTTATGERATVTFVAR